MSLANASDPSVPCVDRKRHAWALSLLVPTLQEVAARTLACEDRAGMFTIAYFPPLWFALMDARLVAAVHCDASRINFSPRRRAALMRRQGLVDFPARPA